MVNFGEVRRAQLAKTTFLTSTMEPLGSFQIFKIYSDAKERVGAESNGKLPHIFISGKTAVLVPEFTVKTCLRQNCSLSWEGNLFYYICMWMPVLLYGEYVFIKLN